MDKKYINFRKIYYRPIEAAIRWSNLFHNEDHILDLIRKQKKYKKLILHDHAEWLDLKFNNDKIYDAILNNELPYGKNGITVDDRSLIDSPWLTVRHVDLKRWISEYYPDERPEFLFSPQEQEAHPTITTTAAQALLAEREMMKIQLQSIQQQHQNLHEQFQEILKKCSCEHFSTMQSLSGRSEYTYLNIIGGLLNLLLGHSPSGHPYSVFKNQNSVITALIAHYGHLMGISERTLQAKFTEAKRRTLPS